MYRCDRWYICAVWVCNPGCSNTIVINPTWFFVMFLQSFPPISLCFYNHLVYIFIWRLLPHYSSVLLIFPAWRALYLPAWLTMTHTAWHLLDAVLCVYSVLTLASCVCVCVACVVGLCAYSKFASHTTSFRWLRTVARARTATPALHLPPWPQDLCVWRRSCPDDGRRIRQG